MAKVKVGSKKKYKGKNIRLSDSAFDTIKKFVDQKGLKLGRFVEKAALKEIQNAN